jgi:hypothetical protein
VYLKLRDHFNVTVGGSTIYQHVLRAETSEYVLLFLRRFIFNVFVLSDDVSTEISKCEYVKL